MEEKKSICQRLGRDTFDKCAKIQGPSLKNGVVIGL